MALPPGTTIREARAKELPLLAAIEADAARRFAEVGFSEILDEEPAPLEFVTAIAASGVVLVAAADDAPVGFALVGFLDRAAHLHELSVSRAHGRLGIGAALVAEACRWAAAEGARAMTLSTFRNVPWNGPFYERRGFRYLERREWTPALHMLHHRERDLGLPVVRRAFMRKDLA